MRQVLFRRDFQNFTGGHLKVWDYFNHANAAPDHCAGISFSPASRWDTTNPWLSLRAQALSEWSPLAADLLFLGGDDWLSLPEPQRERFARPIINLIQHVQHGDLAHPLAQHLPNRAIRICVSQQVHDSILATGRVNGPAVVIPNGIDGPVQRELASAERPVDWLICGVKAGQSALARELAHRITLSVGSDRVDLITIPLPRGDFLDRLSRARRAVLLPRPTEGFYLPALEAMVLGTLVICPDCVGNRSFCQDGRTAIVPVSREPDELMGAVGRARSLNAVPEAAILAAARALAARHSLARERAAFHELLAALPSLW